MTTEVPTADWRSLFKELPVAIEQLESHGAHCSLEAAALFEAALDTLRAPNASRAYDAIVQTIERLALLAQRHSDPSMRHGAVHGDRRRRLCRGVVSAADKR